MTCATLGGHKDLMPTGNDLATTPTVTIGMPVYNGIAHIEQALRALKDQTFGSYELLVSENASTDGTWEILEKWAADDDRIVLHRQPELIDVQANFQYVLDRAKTEYFMWYAVDDWLAPNYLEELLKVFASDPTCALACAPTTKVELDGSLADKRTPPPPVATSRYSRIRELLDNPEGTRIYGLFRTCPLREARALVMDFEYVWSSDHLVLLSFILNDQIRGSENTTFYSRRGSPTPIRYGLSSASEKRRFMGSFLRFHLRAMMSSGLAPFERLMFLPLLLLHAVRTQHTDLFRHFVKRPAKGLARLVTGKTASHM